MHKFTYRVQNPVTPSWQNKVSLWASLSWIQSSIQGLSEQRSCLSFAVLSMSGYSESSARFWLDFATTNSRPFGLFYLTPLFSGLFMDEWGYCIPETYSCRFFPLLNNLADILLFTHLNKARENCSFLGAGGWGGGRREYYVNYPLKNLVHKLGDLSLSPVHFPELFIYSYWLLMAGGNDKTKGILFDSFLAALI